MSAAAVSAAHGKRPVVLVMMGAFWPRSESSGPNLSLKSLCQALADEFDFRILARDRPFGAARPLAAENVWIDQGYARIRYCAVGWRGARGLRRILSETPIDVLWLQGLQDREFSIPALIMRRLGLIPAQAALLSTRGEFGPGALALKARRKDAWLATVRAARMLSGIWLHATGPRERDDMIRRLSFARGIFEAANIRALPELPPHAAADAADGAVLRLAFVGRISPVKNLDVALGILRNVKARVAFDIYGPISEPEYWTRRCLPLIPLLPPNVTAVHRGEIPNDAVPAVLAAADALFLPTAGENFGHAIFEALACGVPALISDQTPWRGLSAQLAGWDLPLADPSGFAAAIESFAAMPNAAREEWRRGARRMAERWHASSDGSAQSRAMLRAVLAAAPGMAD